MNQLSYRKLITYVSLAILMLMLLNPAMANISIKNTTHSNSATLSHNEQSMPEQHHQHHTDSNHNAPASADDCSGICLNCIFCGGMISSFSIADNVTPNSVEYTYLIKSYHTNFDPELHPPIF